MTFNRGLLFWGLALITAGAVALAAQQNVFDRDALAGAWRLWPLILIAIGVSIVLSRTPLAIIGTIAAALAVGAAGGALIAVGPAFASCGGAEPTTVETQRGLLGEAAQVTLDFTCGSLGLAMTSEFGWSVASGREGGGPARITAASDSLNVESGQNARLWGSGRQRWRVRLPTATVYELYITPNAAETTIHLGGGHFTIVSLHPNAGSLKLDLTAAQVDNLDLLLNAGSASISVSEGAHVSGSLSANAGSIELCTEGYLRISLAVEDNFTFSTNLGGSGLVHEGETWSSAPRPYPENIVVSVVDLRIRGNAASFTLNPEGGCA